MRMMAMESGTDELLERIEGEIREFRAEMRDGFERLHRTVIRAAGSLIVALFVYAITQ